MTRRSLLQRFEDEKGLQEETGRIFVLTRRQCEIFGFSMPPANRIGLCCITERENVTCDLYTIGINYDEYESFEYQTLNVTQS